MKKLTALAVFAIANLALASHSFAQTHAVKANIPFDFTLNGQVLPAGTYVIQSKNSHLINLQNLDKPIQALGAVMPDDAVTGGTSKLVFSKYGDQYFLRKIVSEAADMSLTLPVSKLEQARIKQARFQEAAIHSSSQINVAAR